MLESQRLGLVPQCGLGSIKINPTTRVPERESIEVELETTVFVPESPTSESALGPKSIETGPRALAIRPRCKDLGSISMDRSLGAKDSGIDTRVPGPTLIDLSTGIEAHASASMYLGLGAEI